MFVTAAREATASRQHESPSNRMAPSARAPRRVLYVVSRFPSWSETFIVREVSALVDSGVDVRILPLRRSRDTLVHEDAARLLPRCTAPGKGAAESVLQAARGLLASPGPIMTATRIVIADTWRRPVVMLKSLATVLRAVQALDELRKFDPEFIHAHWSTYPTTAAWVASRALRRPFGFTCHAHDVFVNRHMLPRKIRDSALAVTISRHNVEWMAANVTPIASRKFEVVHCGIDPFAIPFRPEGRHGRLILAVGRLVPMKGLHTLIEALAGLHQRSIPFECVIIGDGPERANLATLIARHGLERNVTLRGALAQEQIAVELHRAAVFALPCEVAPDGSRDGIPVALMEAMAAGCPVVSCPVSGIPELIRDGANGALVPCSDGPALAAALQELLGDPALRRRYAVAARARVESEFDVAKEALRLHGLMAEAATHGS